ncbi:MAG: FtsX-like permease family protein [Thermoguttaceae bacterium]|jgi:putative ABC transport system permease protein|nr:FtsX-like permease family protein [Thermoguttaceae bacterium]
MLPWIPYVLKNLWRHRTRSALTVSGAGVAVFVFCVVGAVQDGLDRLTGDRQAARTLVVFQENRFCPTSSRLPQDYARTIGRLDGVEDVLPILVFTNNCRASLDVVMFHGVPADRLRAARDLELLAGDWAAFETRRDAALVGQSVARRRGLRPGNTFSIGEVTVHVAGVFRSSTSAEDNLIFTHLEFLQQSRGAEMVGLVTLFEVRLAEHADAQAVAATIDATFRGGAVATATRNKGIFQTSTLADLADLVVFARWLGYACLGLVLSLVATTTVMAVQDRVRQHAVLQTIGVRPGRLFQLVVSESLLVCVLGGLIGTGSAMVALGWGNFGVGAEGVAVSFGPSLQLGLTGLAVSLLVGLLAGIVPAWQAARMKILEALRQGA